VLNQTEANCQHLSRCAGTWSGLYVNITVNTKGGNSFFRSRKNAANGNQTITIGSGVTGVLQDTTNSDSVSNGDLLDYSISFFADANNLRFQGGGGSEFAATASATSLDCSGNTGGSSQPNGATNYYGQGVLGVGASTPSATEADVLTQLNVATDVTFLSVFIVSNTVAGGSTVRVRKNSADGNGNLSIGSLATGYFEDNTSTDSFTATDEMTIRVFTPAVAASTLSMNSLSALLTVASTVTTTFPGYYGRPTGWF
jgi:hypothetical protein